MSEVTQVLIVAETEGNPSFRVEHHVVFLNTCSTDYYKIFVDGEDKHGKCNADEAIRAMSHYLNAFVQKANKQEV